MNSTCIRCFGIGQEEEFPTIIIYAPAREQPKHELYRNYGTIINSIIHG